MICYRSPAVVVRLAQRRGFFEDVMGNAAVYVFDMNQPILPTPFYSALVAISVFKAVSTVFHSINSPDNSPLSHSVLPVLLLPYGSFQLYISL